MQEQGKNYIVAVELGSACISMAAGYRDSDGKLCVDAVETIESNGCIKRGRVVNVGDTAHKINMLRRRLENRISPYKISKVYVGISGQSIRSVEYRITHTISKDIAIDETLLKEISEEVLVRSKNVNYEIFDIIMGECRVDDRMTSNPCGEFGSEIQVSFRLIVGNDIHKRNLEKVFEQSKLPVAGYITTALATACVVTSKEEMHQGLALVDCGAETTTLSIFREGHLVYLVTIPFGGNNITRDICDLHIQEREAEELKRCYEPKRDGELSVSESWEQQGYYDIKPEKLEEVIVARLEEIIANVVHQLEESRHKPYLAYGITLVGGARKLKGLREMLKRTSGLDVYVGSIMGVNLPKNHNVSDMAQVVGLLQKGDTVCAIAEVFENMASHSVSPSVEQNSPNTPKEEPKVRKSGARAMEGIEKLFKDIVGGDD